MTAIDISERAVVHSRAIAELNSQENILTLFYPNDRQVYLKLDTGDLRAFLQENTINGNLLEDSRIRVNGKEQKLFMKLKKKVNKGQTKSKLSKRLN